MPDFSWIVAGPQATRVLADLGAEVILIENESRLDSVRLNQASSSDRPGYNSSNFNRNKRSITANLHHPAGHEAVE